MPSSRVADRSPGERLEVDVAELAHGGDGVAIVERNGERRAVFVRGALPHERVVAEIDFSSRPARGKLREVVKPSDARIEPPCKFVDRCGGCNWMHITRNAQPHFHAAIVRAQLPESMRDLHILSHPSPHGSRTRARLHVKAHRGQVKIGFFETRSHDPVEVDACIALHPALERARAALAALFEGAKKGDGEVELALGTVRDPDDTRAPVLDVKFDASLPPSFFSKLEAGVKTGAFQGARARPGDAKTPAVVGDPTPWLRHADGTPLRLPPGGFAQASETGNLALAKRVDALAREALAGSDAASIVELFAGAGNFTVLLAAIGAKTIAVESSAQACEVAQANLKTRGLAAKVVVADAESYAIPNRTDVVVLDPPRSGAKGACENVVRAKARHVVYVSCDPATLGRDLAILAAGGYAPKVIETFEMFPDTSHVETVVSLTHERPKK